MTTALLDTLTDEQLAAATAEDPYVHVSAGPGSGKTRVLAARVAWLIERGVDPDLGAGYTTGLFQALSALPLESGEDLNALSEEAATPGGMNAMALRMIEESGAFETFRSALDAVIARYPEII